jgi:hypothetical protein
MKMRPTLIRDLFPGLLAGLTAIMLAGCESWFAADRQAGVIDGPDPISRDVAHTQGGIVHDPTSLSPPPIRREYTNER